MNLLSIYETSHRGKTEVMRILAQGIATPERLIKFTERIRKANASHIEKGRYETRQEIFQHSSKAQKPYLDKYKIK